MPVIFVCTSCRHRVSVSRRYVGKDRSCPACHETVHVPEIADELFFELAKRLGFPSTEVLEPYASMQRERAALGKRVALFQLLCDNGVLTLGEESRFRALAQEAHGHDAHGESESTVERTFPSSLANTLAPPEPDELQELERQRVELEQQRAELEKESRALERRVQRLTGERPAPLAPGSPDSPTSPAPTSPAPAPPKPKRRSRRPRS